MTDSKNKSLAQKVVIVLIGALLMGLLWRVRGTTGWGSSWGLLNAGFIFTMFVIIVKGVRQKMTAGWLGLTALSFMLTVPGWGTLLKQITGVVYEPSAEGVIDSMVFVSVPSAIFIMLSLGFGLATLFGIMLGRGYSDKQWKIKDFIILIVVFYAVDLITKATVSHWLLDLIQPQAGEVFEAHLLAGGHEADAYKAYLAHFDNISWAKKIEGGRNYFASVETISSMFRAVAVLLVTRFIIKDKISARTGLVVSGAFAFSITVSDLFFYFGAGGYHMENPSYFPDWVYPWSCWEFCTGLIAGGIITAFILSLKKTEDVPEITFAKVPEKATTVLAFIIGYVFLIGVNIVRPVLERFDGSDYQILFIIISVVAAAAVIFLVAKALGVKAQEADMMKFSKILLPVFVAYDIIAYLFIGIAEDQNFREIEQVDNIACIVASVIVVAWSLMQLKKEKIK